MKTLSSYKEAHLNQAASRWDEALKGVRRFLTYDRRKLHPGLTPSAASDEHDAQVRQLTHKLFSVTNGIRFNVLGGISSGFGIQMSSYAHQMPYDPCELMEFIQFFVGHEILDDGEPGVGYYRNTIGDPERTSESFVLCTKDHPKAEPYFHRNIDELRKFDPNAEHLTLDLALEILAWYEKREARLIETLQHLYPEEDVQCRIDSDNASRHGDLADAIIAMMDPT